MLSLLLGFLGALFGFWVAKKRGQNYLNNIELIMLLAIWIVGGVSFLQVFK
ncbi:Uncharacterised protein [uncultured Avibacterium sp.]|uniref:Uncharacterized protein n=1 Tax=uncultured Avibacterium sp. TaxID=1936169 RepID=A0A486X9Z6_9PAST|nr:Uncharacterised protein [uncultured Avibacterium sp.]